MKRWQLARQPEGRGMRGEGKRWVSILYVEAVFRLLKLSYRMNITAVLVWFRAYMHYLI